MLSAKVVNPRKNQAEILPKAEFPMLQAKMYDAAEKKLLELPPIE
jgi:hypothetical protein